MNSSKGFKPEGMPLALLVLLLLLIGYILIHSFYFPGMVPDAHAYLYYAQQLILGHGYTLPTLTSERLWITVAPLGYPGVLALFSIVLPNELFWIAKVVNITCLALMFWMLARLFGRHALLYGSILLLPLFLGWTTQSLSEIPFMTTLFFLAVVLHRFSHTPTLNNAILLGGLGCLAFLFRYIGVFTVVLFLLMGIVALIGRRISLARGVGLAAGMNALFCSGYFLFNQMQAHRPFPTQFLHPSRFTWSEKTGALVQQVMAQFSPLPNVPIIGGCLLGLLAGFILIHHFKSKSNAHPVSSEDDKTIWQAFLWVGGVYWLCVITILCQKTFTPDIYPARHLIAGTLLLWFALFSYFQYHSRLFQPLKILIITVNLLAFVMMMGKDIHRFQKGTVTYNEQKRAVLQTYSLVDPGDLILYGIARYQYLRPDIVYFKPFYRKPLLNLVGQYCLHNPDNTVYLELSRYRQLVKKPDVLLGNRSLDKPYPPFTLIRLAHCREVPSDALSGN